MDRVLILGSVFLPGFVMDPLVSALSARGVTAHCVTPVDVGTAEAAAAVYSEAADRFGASTVIAYSNAGNFVPAVAAKSAVNQVVFMDAVVPPLSGGTWPVVPEQMRDWVLSIAADDKLPRWTRWWPEQDVRELFPDAETFAKVDAATPSLPTTYPPSLITATADWSVALDIRYLAFGSTYAEEVAIAETRGWPARILELGHLGMLQDPEVVAEALLDT